LGQGSRQGREKRGLAEQYALIRALSVTLFLGMASMEVVSGYCLAKNYAAPGS
jgi:hypothetical protein